MNVILFIVTVTISFVVVRVGAVALHITGLEWPLSKFQALSCFSGTGFTTREAELITSHPKRRQIATILMVLGNAGLVTLIATFANSIRPQSSAGRAAGLWSQLHPFLNLLIIAAALYIAYRLLTRTAAVQRLTDFARSKLRKSGIVEPVSFEELLVSTGGYGIARVEVREDSPLAGQTIAESGLRTKDVTILVVRDHNESIANPPAQTAIKAGNVLLCFGNLDRMKSEFSTAH
jgi:hypothetical protein